MKKIVLALCAVAISVASFAQFSQMNGKPSPATKAGVEWHQINNPMTVIDFNGNTVNIADTLAAGKALVIDYSATWCSWCWVMHTNGILEAIKEQLGNDVCVLWVESDPTTTNPAEITGSGSTQGDWTNGGTVPYPIINDETVNDLIGNNNISGYPTVVFVSPSGYWCDVYGTDWGFGPYDADEAVSAISNLLEVYPRPNHVPIVTIGGNTTVVVGGPATFTANITSVDQVTSIEWSVDGGDPATGTGESFTTTFATAGDYTVTLSVTNTTGTTTETLNVNAIELNWGDDMTYSMGEEEGALGAGGMMYWAVKYPASKMAGRTYLSSVDIFIPSSTVGKLTMKVYQGGDNAPDELLYSRDYTVNASFANSWYTCYPHEQSIALDDTKNLWIVFSKNGGYPAAYSTYIGMDDGDYLSVDGNNWTTGAAVDYPGEWMIITTTKNYVGVSEVLGSEVAIYPNPSTGLLNISADGLQEVSVMDLGGRTLMTVNSNVVNISDLNAGVYFVRVVSANGVSTQKVVKK